MRRNFDSREALISEITERIFADGRAYTDIAEETGVVKSTINRLAIGRTRWPRPTTLFPLLDTLGLKLTLTELKDISNE